MIYNAVLGVTITDEETDELDMPVRLQELAIYLRITNVNDQTLAEKILPSAIKYCEDFTGISILYKKIKCVVNNSQGGILLPYGPIKNGTLVVKNSEGNTVDFKTTPQLDFATYLNLLTPKDEVLICEYYAGIGISSSNQTSKYPAWVKIAVMQQCGYMWENRGDEKVGLSTMAKTTMMPYKRVM